MHHTDIDWVSVKLVSGKRLYLSSDLAVPHLCNNYKISRNNVADMRSIPEQAMLDARKGLREFMGRLDSIQNLDEDMIIHCHLGLNRTPVAAVIFLVERLNYQPSLAQNIVEAAIKQRKPDYTLNEKEYYELPLKEVETRYHQRNAPRFHSSKVRVAEVHEINKQKKDWYGI